MVILIESFQYQNTSQICDSILTLYFNWIPRGHLNPHFPTLAESQFRPYPISYLFAWQQLSRGEFYGTCTHFINPEGLVSDVSVDC